LHPFPLHYQLERQPNIAEIIILINDSLLPWSRFSTQKTLAHPIFTFAPLSTQRLFQEAAEHEPAHIKAVTK
jgi:hypothetical protein